jgi:hypothetical protein
VTVARRAVEVAEEAAGTVARREAGAWAADLAERRAEVAQLAATLLEQASSALAEVAQLDATLEHVERLERGEAKGAVRVRPIGVDQGGEAGTILGRLSAIVLEPPSSSRQPHEELQAADAHDLERRLALRAAAPAELVEADRRGEHRGLNLWVSEQRRAELEREQAAAS